MPVLRTCRPAFSCGARCPADEQKTAAIVGARICTAYGKSQAAFFAQVLAANGVAVISGLACGIDAAAHEGALRGKGKDVCPVLGCGVDIAIRNRITR